MESEPVPFEEEYTPDDSKKHCPISLVKDVAGLPLCTPYFMQVTLKQRHVVQHGTGWC